MSSITACQLIGSHPHTCAPGPSCPLFLQVAGTTQLSGTTTITAPTTITVANQTNLRALTLSGGSSTNPQGWYTRQSVSQAPDLQTLEGLCLA